MVALVRHSILVCRGRIVHWLVLPLFILWMSRKELGHHDAGCREFKGHHDAGCREAATTLLAVGRAATTLAAGPVASPRRRLGT